MGKKRKADSAPLSGIAGLIDQLSRSLVLAEPDDPPALAKIHTMFCDAAQWAWENGQARLAAAARQTSDLVENIILCDVASPAAALETVNRVAAILQAVVLQGQDLETVKFPEELKLDEAAAAGAGAARACDCDYSMPANIDPAIFAEFITRQSAALEELEAAVLALEKTPNAQKLTQLKRLLHTLKGEAALLGLKLIEQVCHATEAALERRSPALMADCLLVVRDWLDQALKAYAGKGPHPRSPEYFLSMLAGEPSSAGSGAPAPFAAPDEAPAPAPPMPLEGDVALIGDFVNESKEHLEAVDVALLDLETDSQDMESINALFRRFHTIKGVAGFLGLEHVRALSHESESLLDRARKGEILLAGSAIDVIFDAADALKAMINAIQCSITSGNPIPADEELPRLLRRIQAAASGAADEGSNTIAPERAGGRRLGEILVETGVASKENVETALNMQNSSPEAPRLGEILVREGQAAARDVAHALRAQRASNAGQTMQVKETVKVDADRLDRLVEMIGELVIAESMVSQSGEVREAASAQLMRHLNQLDKITRELQEMGTSLRMVPLRATFQKMARLVRDLSKKFGKQVEFAMAGEDTELDKTVVDKIGDPLVHMIRNALDHGLEAGADERTAAGKPAAGRVELRAFHKGGNIYIEIHDDGKGLDRKAIIAKAIERGLIRDGEALSDREVYNLVFQPGFSTAKVVTDVSGRGVGMDVVKRNIDALRGQIDITSEVGKGTTFSIRLPLTLAIIDGMVIRVGSERYIIPTLSIIRSIRPKPSELSSILGRGEMLAVHGKLLPLFRLDRLFNVSGSEQDATRSIAVIVEDEGRQIGLLIDELLGQQQIVIKSLGEAMRGIPGIAGGAIMPDGHVGLILDVGGLVRLAHLKTNMNGAEDGRDPVAGLAGAAARN